MNSEAVGKKEAPLPQLKKMGWPPDIPWAFPRVLLGTRWFTGRSTWPGPSSAPPPTDFCSLSLLQLQPLQILKLPVDSCSAALGSGNATTLIYFVIYTAVNRAVCTAMFKSV